MTGPANLADCGCPVIGGMVRHQRATCTDPVVARLDWYAGAPEHLVTAGGHSIAPDPSTGLEELAGLISFRVGEWHDFGYETPPAPNCKTIPPLGERSAQAIRGGHAAIEAIDDLIRQLHALRAQLVGELRQDEDIRMERTGRMLANSRERRGGDEPGAGFPVYPPGQIAAEVAEDVHRLAVPR